MASLTERLADIVSTNGVKTVYGEKVETEGTTILPVAIASFGFGAGEVNEKGESGGGGGAIAPVGAYVTRDGYTRFEPNLITLLVVATPFVWIAGRALSRIIKALKK